jgi:hypothetical protein
VQFTILIRKTIKFINFLLSIRHSMEMLDNACCYCQFCGSPDLVTSEKKYQSKTDEKQTTEFDIRPIELIGFKLGKERGRESGRESSLPAMLCMKCYNINSRYTSMKSCFPMYFISLDPTLCIIPHTLRVQMLHNKCYEADAHEILKEKRDKLEECYREWSVTNCNPCNGNKRGYQLPFTIGNVHINCWVIVDIIEEQEETKLQSEHFRIFRDLPFWISDIEEHKKADIANNGIIFVSPQISC